MANIFAYRTKSPGIMKKASDPVGPQNDQYLKMLNMGAGITICAWGTHGSHQNRESEVLAYLKNPHCLTITNKGHPGHPLYLKKNLKPIVFNGQGLTQLTEGKFNIHSASWEKDGFIYFSADAGGNIDIWRLKPKIE